MKAKDFVKKYKKEFEAASNKLKNFEYNMYEYDDDLINNMDTINSFNVDDYGKKMLDMVVASIEDNRNFLRSHISENYDYLLEAYVNDDPKFNPETLFEYNGIGFKQLNDNDFIKWATAYSKYNLQGLGKSKYDYAYDIVFNKYNYQRINPDYTNGCIKDSNVILKNPLSASLYIQNGNPEPISKLTDDNYINLCKAISIYQQTMDPDEYETWEEVYNNFLKRRKSFINSSDPMFNIKQKDYYNGTHRYYLNDDEFIKWCKAYADFNNKIQNTELNTWKKVFNRYNYTDRKNPDFKNGPIKDKNFKLVYQDESYSEYLQNGKYVPYTELTRENYVKWCQCIYDWFNETYPELYKSFNEVYESFIKSAKAGGKTMGFDVVDDTLSSAYSNSDPNFNPNDEFKYRGIDFLTLRNNEFDEWCKAYSNFKRSTDSKNSHLYTFDYIFNTYNMERDYPDYSKGIFRDDKFLLYDNMEESTYNDKPLKNLSPQEFDEWCKNIYTYVKFKKLTHEYPTLDSVRDKFKTKVQSLDYNFSGDYNFNENEPFKYANKPLERLNNDDFDKWCEAYVQFCKKTLPPQIARGYTFDFIFNNYNYKRYKPDYSRGIFQDPKFKLIIRNHNQYGGAFTEAFEDSTYNNKRFMKLDEYEYVEWCKNIAAWCKFDEQIEYSDWKVVYDKYNKYRDHPSDENNTKSGDDILNSAYQQKPENNQLDDIDTKFNPKRELTYNNKNFKLLNDSEFDAWCMALSKYKSSKHPDEAEDELDLPENEQEYSFMAIFNKYNMKRGYPDYSKGCVTDPNFMTYGLEDPAMFRYKQNGEYKSVEYLTDENFEKWAKAAYKYMEYHNMTRDGETWQDIYKEYNNRRKKIVSNDTLSNNKNQSNDDILNSAYNKTNDNKDNGSYYIDDNNFKRRYPGFDPNKQDYYNGEHFSELLDSVFDEWATANWEFKAIHGTTTLSAEQFIRKYSDYDDYKNECLRRLKEEREKKKLSYVSPDPKFDPNVINKYNGVDFRKLKDSDFDKWVVLSYNYRSQYGDNDYSAKEFNIIYDDFNKYKENKTAIREIVANDSDDEPISHGKFNLKNKMCYDGKSYKTLNNKEFDDWCRVRFFYGKDNEFKNYNSYMDVFNEFNRFRDNPDYFKGALIDPKFNPDSVMFYGDGLVSRIDEIEYRKWCAAYLRWKQWENPKEYANKTVDDIYKDFESIYRSNDTPKEFTKSIDDADKIIKDMNRVNNVYNTNKNNQSQNNKSFKRVQQVPRSLSEMRQMSRDLADENHVAIMFSEDMGLNRNGFKVKSNSDIENGCYAVFRGGKTDKQSTTPIQISNLDRYIRAIERSDVDSIKVYSGKVDSAYRKIVDKINEGVNKIDKADNSNMSAEDKTDLSTSVEIMRNCSKCISLYQGFHNTYIKAWRDVVAERDNAYKSMLIAAVSNANRSMKEDKNK